MLIVLIVMTVFHAAFKLNKVINCDRRGIQNVWNRFFFYCKYSYLQNIIDIPAQKIFLKIPKFQNFSSFLKSLESENVKFVLDYSQRISF